MPRNQMHSMSAFGRRSATAESTTIASSTSKNINDKILADISRAQFVVADFTHHPNGVYFEAGFALGLGKLVIWRCRLDEFRPDRVHFDTQPYNHIERSDILERTLRIVLKFWDARPIEDEPLDPNTHYYDLRF